MTYKFAPYPKNQPGFIDLAGKVLDRWTILGYLGDSVWLCICECGYIAEQKRSDLVSGKTKGCRDCLSSSAVGYDIDLTDKKVGRLTVLEYVGNSKWLCQCSCGNTCTRTGQSIRYETTNSCGCINREATIARNKTYKRPGSPLKRENLREYHSWVSMKQRCSNPKNNAYARYGGRGIKVHKEWVNSFEAFFVDLGPCPEGYTLDRIDHDGNYEPSNCRWADKNTQATNKSGVVKIEFNGTVDTLSGWARKIGISPESLKSRLNQWPLEKALTSPKLNSQGKVISQ